MYLKDAVEKFWNITSFEFIDQQEFDKRRYDSKYSFLVLMKASFDKDPGGVTYNYLSLVLGDVAANLTDMPELCSVPLSYSDDNNNDFEYAIPAIVKFMQKHARNLEFNRFFISMKGLKFYNGSGSFKGKGLLLNSEMMASNANSPDKIKAAYPNYVKFLTVSGITEELSSNPTNSLFLFHVGPTLNSPAGKCFEMIFDTEGNLYYYNARKITNDNENGFNMKDFYAIR